MNDDIETERREQYRPPSKGNPKNYLAEKRNLILIGAGVLIVVLIFLLFRFSGKDKSTETLVQMEQKLAAIEQKIAALEKQQEDLARPCQEPRGKSGDAGETPHRKAHPPCFAKGASRPPGETLSQGNKRGNPLRHRKEVRALRRRVTADEQTFSETHLGCRPEAHRKPGRKKLTHSP